MAVITSLNKILEVRVCPWKITGSPSSPSQQSTAEETRVVQSYYGSSYFINDHSIGLAQSPPIKVYQVVQLYIHVHVIHFHIS